MEVPDGNVSNLGRFLNGTAEYSHAINRSNGRRCFSCNNINATVRKVRNNEKLACYDLSKIRNTAGVVTGYPSHLVEVKAVV